MQLKGKLVLSWTNAGFTLQSAPALTGQFTNFPAATSPYTNPLTAPQQIFRLISNRTGRVVALRRPAPRAAAQQHHPWRGFYNESSDPARVGGRRNAPVCA